ncbi:hypothetical protein FIBSPDRAFT_393113 [Athelia psychrophila]|uniref:Uncharacterized protein n=1 Tax=Athelia psychrophila TaxID=1759441 RepID=A0A166NKE0_9AGAM|nr:hypothetical protein FIBSPDRAFT_393113 [Fibularhizoctonia sp. CBS 109695]
MHRHATNHHAASATGCRYDDACLHCTVEAIAAVIEESNTCIASVTSSSAPYMREKGRPTP